MSGHKILREVENRLGGDWRFQNGTILGSMCSAPDPLAHLVYEHTMDINIGDPGLSKGMLELEREAVGMIGGFLGLPGAPGRIVSGGTEANILGLWTARRLLAPGERKTRRRVLAPTSRHFSIDKAVDLMDLELVLVETDTDGRLSLTDLKSRLDSRTLAVVGMAGSTGLGTVDDLPAIGGLAAQAGVYLHVDASFGGFVLPFLEEAGFPAPAFGLDLPGVCSVSIDPHKMGRGPIPSGCILWRDASMEYALEIPVGYLSGGKTRLSTLTGTRSGASVAAVWAVLRSLGRQGFVRSVREAMELTFWLQSKLESAPGIRVVADPVLNVLGFSHRSVPSNELAERLREKGWALSEWPGYLRVVLMPHVKKGRLKKFLKDLEETLRGTSKTPGLK